MTPSSKLETAWSDGHKPWSLCILSVPFESDLVNADDTQFVQKVDACSVNSGARGCNKCLDQNILLKTGIRNTNLMQQLYNDKDTPWWGEHIVTGAEKAADQVG